MKGPASRFAYDPAVLVAYLDSHSTHNLGGFPQRRRHAINGTWVDSHDARIIRRWRSGVTEGVTLKAASDLLDHYDLTLHTFESWAIAQDRRAVKRGQLTLPLTTQTTTE